jgi:hypothetical protein
VINRKIVSTQYVTLENTRCLFNRRHYLLANFDFYAQCGVRAIESVINIKGLVLWVKLQKIVSAVWNPDRGHSVRDGEW